MIESFIFVVTATVGFISIEFYFSICCVLYDDDSVGRIGRSSIYVGDANALNVSYFRILCFSGWSMATRNQTDQFINNSAR